MNKEKFVIFTDEAGSWSNRKNKFYIRSWVRFNSVDLAELNTIHNKNSFDIVRHFGKKANLFFTFTDLSEFYDRKFIFRDEINKEIFNVFVKFENRVKDYIKKIPIGVENAVNHVLFLSIYEKFHIINALERFNISKDDLVVFEKPQFNERDFKELIDNLKIKFHYKIYSESKMPEEFKKGRKMVHDLVNCFYKSLNEDDNQKKIFQTMLYFADIKNGNISEGINKIFLNDETDKINWMIKLL